MDEYGKVEPSGSLTNITPMNPTSFGGSAQVDFTFQVMLQARRFGFDRDGRHYTIDVTASDMAGNTGVGSAVVIVPHDMGRKHGFHGTGHQGSQGETEGGGLTARVPMDLAVRATAQDLWEARLEPVKITAMEMATATEMATAAEMAMTKETEMVTGTVMETVTVTATGRAKVNP